MNDSAVPVANDLPLIGGGHTPMPATARPRVQR